METIRPCDRSVGLRKKAICESGAIRRARLFSSSSLMILVVILLSVFYPLPGSAHLYIRNVCGEITCQAHEYCSKFDHTCSPCSTVCKEDSNNFSKDTCEDGCQDYIHDERYIRNGLGNESGFNQDIGSMYQSLQRDVVILKILVGVCLVVIVIILGSFVTFVTYFWKYIYPSSNSKYDANENDTDNKKGSTKAEKKQKIMELPTIYDNRQYCSSPGLGRRDLNHHSRNEDAERQQSPSKVSATETMNSLNSAKTSAATVSTMVNSNGGSQRFQTRKEPSESTLPECMAYDNASIAPSQIYSHHV